MFITKTFDFKSSAKLSLFYIITVLIFYSLFSFYQISNHFRSNFIPTISMSENIMVVVIDEKSLEKIGTWPWERSASAEIISKLLSYQPKKLGIDILFAENNKPSLELENVLKDNRVVVANQFENTNLVGNVDNAGFTNLPVDEDGKIRKVISENNNKQSFASKISNKSNIPKSFLLNPNVKLPKTISLSEIIDDPSLGKILENKTVIFGSNISSLGDFKSIEGFGLIPGVYIHALILNQIEQGQYSFTSSLSSFEELIMIFFATILLLIALNNLKLNFYIFTLLNLTILQIIAFTPTLNPLFSLEFLLANSVGLIILMLYTYILINLFEKFKLHKTLSLYLPRQLTQIIHKKQGVINLGGEIKKTTLLFTDIRGFTKMTEEFENTEELAIFLNKILDLQTNIIHKNFGIVDKYIGDAVMAFWGAPIANSNDEFNAIMAGCQIIASLKNFNQKNNSNVNLGVGISTGQSMVGNFGSTDRFNYTVIGDVVNTASRIESLNKTYGSSILIDQNTLEALDFKSRSHFIFGEVDKIRLRGKNKVTILYEVLFFLDSDKSEWIQVGEGNATEKLYLKGLKLYYKGEFAKARKNFAELKSVKAKLLTNRCAELISNPPTVWRGVWNFQSKG
jgi:adenylate cyclase